MTLRLRHASLPFAPPKLFLTALALPALVLPAGVWAAVGPAQQAPGTGGIPETRRAIVEAQRQSVAARTRAERLEAEAARATLAAEKTAREAAALAARIQEAEAGIVAAEGRMRIIAGQRRELRNRLAQRRQPLVRLTAALQRLSRRPPAMALLRPGSVRDVMYMRALLAVTVPEVERNTAALKAEIVRGRILERRALATARELHASEAVLGARRNLLTALETRQRLASRQAAGDASREAERALALAEKAKDLGQLVKDLGRAGALRDALARLPGPILRPLRPEASQVIAVEATAAPQVRTATYILPVSGQLVAGFGESRGGQPRSRGIALAVRPGAQAVAPAPGRVAFAAPYRGYGRIVIIEHDGGWTSLITGLARLDTRVGESVLAGSPLGTAGAGNPVITLELRHDGEPVNPL